MRMTKQCVVSPNSRTIIVIKCSIIIALFIDGALKQNMRYLITWVLFLADNIITLADVVHHKHTYVCQIENSTLAQRSIFYTR